MEIKSINLEIKDFDKGKREVVIAHAAYNNIDRTQDISRKGMFNRSWKENKSDIGFYKNHDANQVPGKTLDFWEDDNFAYTKAYLGTHTMGEDTMRMIDEGIITKASFGYIAEKKNYIEVKGQKVRELKEVIHRETSVLTVLQANPLAKVVSLSKALDENDIIILTQYKKFIDSIEDKLRKSTVSDEQIKALLLEIEEAKQFISKYDTVDTQDEKSLETAASKNENDSSLLKQLLILKTKI